MLVSNCDLKRAVSYFPYKGLSRKYMQECEMKPGDTYVFEFSHTVKPGNYIALCEAFMFGYGRKNDDHHIKTIRMDIHADITGANQNCVTVTAFAEMCDTSGHLMTLQGEDNSYIRVGVIALPDNVPHGVDDVVVNGLCGFEVTYPDGKSDHHLQELRVFIPEIADTLTPAGAYMQDDSKHTANGKVLSAQLRIPQTLLQNYDPTTGGSIDTFIYIHGFKMRNDKGDTHIRQLGVDPTKYDSEFAYYVLRDKHGNHANSKGNIMAGNAFVFME